MDDFESTPTGGTLFDEFFQFPLYGISGHANWPIIQMVTSERPASLSLRDLQGNTVNQPLSASGSYQILVAVSALGSAEDPTRYLMEREIPLWEVQVPGHSGTLVYDFPSGYTVGGALMGSEDLYRIQTSNRQIVYVVGAGLRVELLNERGEVLDSTVTRERPESDYLNTPKPSPVRSFDAEGVLGLADTDDESPHYLRIARQFNQDEPVSRSPGEAPRLRTVLPYQLRLY